MKGKRKDVYLVCGGKYHDFDFARLELLKLLAEHDVIRVKVANDYRDIDGMCSSDLLVTYTCDEVPDKDGQVALQEFVQEGGKWFGLHATNSVLTWVTHDPPLLRAPRDEVTFMETLGSQFLAHPPVENYKVEISDPSHELVAGIAPFDTVDELYLSEYHGKHHCLLHTHFNGRVDAFEDGDWTNDDAHPVFYLKSLGQGEVLYLTLGHCRSTFDMQPLIEEYPEIERCSWELPQYYELLRRCIKWGIS